VELRIVAPDTLLEAGTEKLLKAEAKYSCEASEAISDKWWEVTDPKWSVRGEAEIKKGGVLYSEKAGVVEVTAEYGGLSSTISVEITPGKPLIFKLSGPSEGYTGEQLSESFKVKVKDRFENPIKDEPVQFLVSDKPNGAKDEKVSRDEVKTDSSGSAEVKFTVGTKPGDYIIRAELANDPDQSCNFKINATPMPEILTISFDPEGNPPKVASQGTIKVMVTVTDRFYNPVVGMSVELKPSESGAKFDPLEPKTDGNGIATATLTAWEKANIDDEAKIYKVIASCDGLREEREIKVTEGEPYRMEKLPHNEEIEISQSIELSVKVLDKPGNPVSEVEVKFTIVSVPPGVDKAKWSWPAVNTDKSGVAIVQFTAGKEADITYVIHAENPKLNGSPVEFSVHTNPGPPDRLVELSGNIQQGIVKEQLQKPFAVMVADIGGNSVPGVKVKFVVVQFPEGSTEWEFNDDMPITDSIGEAKVWFTPGTVMGNYGIFASANKAEEPALERSEGTQLQGSPVHFTCFADHGEPQIISGVSGRDQTGIVGKPLPKPFVVKVTDRFNNPVDGVEIKFRIAEQPPSNDAHLESPVRTDKSGLANSILTFATKAGKHEVHAVFETSEVPFHAEAGPDKPEKVINISGDNQSGNLKEPLSESLIVRVSDIYDNPCPNINVTFSVTESPPGASGMTLSPETANTDKGGYAQTRFTLGDKIGKYRITAKLTDYPEKLVKFSAIAWECTLKVSPDKLNLGYEKSNLNLILKREGEGCTETLKFEAESAKPWVGVEPASGEISDSPITLTVSVKRDSLEPGIHESTLSIQYGGKTVSVPISIEVRRKLIVRVVNARSGKAVPGAIVKVIIEEIVATTNNHFTSFSAASGEAIFEDFRKNGAITLSVSCDGYIPKSEIENVPPANDFVAEIHLKPIPRLINEISSHAAFPFSAPKFVAFSPDGMRAYVTNNMDDTVSIIDTSTDKVIQSEKVKSWPEEVAINPVLDEAYVACSRDDCIVVITKANEFGRIINVGNSPTGVAVSQESGLLFVTNMLGGSVSIVDTKIGQEKAKIPVGREPISIAANQSKSPNIYLYVSNQGDGTVSVIDVSTEREVDVIRVGDEPWGIAESPSGKFVYVANYGSGMVSMIDTSNNKVVKTFDVGKLPVDIAVDPRYPDEDVLYVTISSTDSVTVIDAASEIVLKEAIPVGAFPQGISITNDGGKIYVVNSDSETISVLGF
jgi:YVTN family beta-propeller protein